MNEVLPLASEIESAARAVYGAMRPTPQLAWPLLQAALGTEVWVKHENHTPTGAFKIRGGLVYIDELKRREPDLAGVISATRGNHGQSVGFAARRHDLAATIVVPRGNSTEKNAAMRALGVRLIEHGGEFQDAREHAAVLAREHGLHMIPSCHRDLVRGVATYWMEFFTACADLDVVFVPVGQGSGICAAIAAREALGMRTRIVGVVSAHALAYKLSYERGRITESPVGTVLADGMACRVPDAAAFDAIQRHVDDMVAVTDAEVARAMRLYFCATHNVAEGAGAAALAAAMQQQPRLAGLRVGVTLSGGNVDQDSFARVLGEETESLVA
ncbi:MAG TPA: threonine dehydratase [Noviherbaspirillum sp.]|nr:threonine dehydratase [Noviherbaspirillum sp.]